MSVTLCCRTKHLMKSSRGAAKAVDHDHRTLRMTLWTRQRGWPSICIFNRSRACEPPTKSPPSSIPISAMNRVQLELCATLQVLPHHACSIIFGTTYAATAAVLAAPNTNEYRRLMVCKNAEPLLPRACRCAQSRNACWGTRKAPGLMFPLLPSTGRVGKPCDTIRAGQTEMR